MDAGMFEYLKRLRPLVDKQGRWAFVPNARTASTSIARNALAGRAMIFHRTPNHWDWAWNRVRKNADAVFFTVVRNSWDRVLSAWKFLRMHHRTDMDFVTFLKSGQLANLKYEHFFRPQTRAFLYGGVLIKEMNVLRFENFDETWATIAEKLNVPKQLPKRNHVKHRHYTKYYDLDCVRIVGRMYAAEISELGYEFG